MKLTKKTGWTLVISLAAAALAVGTGAVIWWTHH